MFHSFLYRREALDIEFPLELPSIEPEEDPQIDTDNEKTGEREQAEKGQQVKRVVRHDDDINRVAHWKQK